jgi:hypothetical protein
MALIASFALDINLDSFVHFYYKYSYFSICEAEYIAIANVPLMLMLPIAIQPRAYIIKPISD